MQARPSSFFGQPCGLKDYKRAAVVILPIPFDKTSTWGKGADKGPRAILDASPYLESYDIETEGSVLEKGIYTAKAIKAGASPLMIKRAEAAVTQYLKDGKFMVALGGEHSVSIGPIKAYSGHYQNLSILHLDAHADSRDSYEGSRYNHACVIARAREHVKNIVSVGIRSMDISEIPNVDPKRMFYAHAIHDSEKWMTKAAAVLTDTVYVTIDVDVFETGIMPATGTPEPGGLGWYQVLKFLKIVATTKKIVGFDVVELCPSGARAPEFLAAKLVYTLLSYIFYL